MLTKFGLIVIDVPSPPRWNTREYPHMLYISSD